MFAAANGRGCAPVKFRPWGAATELQLCAGRELRMRAGNELRFVKFLELRKAAANFPWAARPKFDF